MIFNLFEKAAFQSKGSYTFLTCSGNLAKEGVYDIKFAEKGNKQRVCDVGEKIGVKVEFNDGLARISYYLFDSWKVAFEKVEGPLHPLVCLQSDNQVSLIYPEEFYSK